jgi:flavin-dependent dehydrogenase
MRQAKVVIVGGGPAGAACAEKLVKAGVDILVVDKQSFPREKLCAGWLTPGVFNSLGISPMDYPYDLSVFPYLKIYIAGIPVLRRGVQYAIRRLEFDQWLLNRSGAEIIQHEVRRIESTDLGYNLDGKIKAEILVGAGGTHCPVYRKFYSGTQSRTGGKIITLEEEIKENWSDSECRLWFFENGLPGYAWYVPKRGGYINLGVGGNAAVLRERGSTIQAQWDYLIEKVRRMGLVKGKDYDPGGYVYHLRGSAPAVIEDNLYLVGDAAGLATLDMGEGIGPAIRSGQLAADAILGRSPYNMDSIPAYSILPPWLRWLVR